MSAAGAARLVVASPARAPQPAGPGGVLGRVPPGASAAVLADRIEAVFLTEAGWDPQNWVLTLTAEHPLLGRPICRAAGCRTTCFERTGVCLDCRRRLAIAGLGLDDIGFLEPPRGARWSGPDDGICTVVGCPRPWVSNREPLCPEHLGAQQRLGVDMTAFVGRADVAPLPGHGVCAVVACPRQLPVMAPPIAARICSGCGSCAAAGEQPDETVWRLTEPPVSRAGQVSLAGLDPTVAVEILFGLQQRTRQGVKTNTSILRAICNDARSQQVSTLAALTVPTARGTTHASVVHTLVTHARRGRSTPDTEIVKDSWDMALFGHRGLLSFTAISQAWLRETAKILGIVRPAPAPGPQRLRQDPSPPVQPGAALRQPARSPGPRRRPIRPRPPRRRAVPQPSCLSPHHRRDQHTHPGDHLPGGPHGADRRPATRRDKVRRSRRRARATSSACIPATSLQNPPTPNRAGTCLRRSCGTSATGWTP